MSAIPGKAFLRLGHPLQPREPAMGYAARLAALNGVDLPRLLGDMRIDISMLGRGEGEALKALADLRDLGPADRDALTRFTPSRETGDKVATAAGHRLLPGSILAASTRVCPRCIAEDLERFDGPRQARPWLRLEWVLKHARICRRHRTILLDVVPPATLRAGHDFSRTLDRQVLPVLDRLCVEAVPGPGTAYADWLVARLDGTRDPANWLDDGPLHAAVAFCEALGISALHGPGARPSLMSTLEMATAAEDGYRVASQGPPAIEVLLDRIVDAHQSRKRGSVGHEKIYGQVHAVLRRTLNDDCFGRFRHVLREHAFTTLPICAGTSFLGTRLKDRVIHSQRSAAFSMARSDAGLLRLVGADRVKDGKPLTLTVPELNRLVGKIEDLLTAKDVAARTGFSPEQVARLEEAGLLPSLPEPDRFAGTNRRFPRPGVDAVMERLFREAVPGPTTFGSKMTVERAAPGLTVSVVEILRLILDDRLEWVGRQGAGGRYNQLMVDKDEVRKVLHGPRSDTEIREGDALSRLPGVSRQNLWRLVRAGLLEWSPRYRPRDPGAARALTKDSVETFAIEYVMPVEIEAATGVSVTAVRKRLADAGVVVAVDRDAVKCSIYRRRDVAAARLFEGWPDDER